MNTTILLASDHAGYETKKNIKSFLEEKGFKVIDLGPFVLDLFDDYPDFISKVAKKVSGNPDKYLGIIFGGSGQGEAIVANRFKNIRSVVYYGQPSFKQIDSDGKEIDIITSTRKHNNSNILSIGARFLKKEDIEKTILNWINTEFEGDERHKRRIKKIEKYSQNNCILF